MTLSSAPVTAPPVDPYHHLDAHPGREHRCGPKGRRGARRRRLGRTLTRGGRLLDQVAIRVMEPVFLSGTSPQIGADVLARMNRASQVYADPAIFSDPARLEAAMSDSRTVRSYCRICIAACGVLVDVEGDRVVRVKGDPNHPLSRGYTCPKGRAMGELQHHAERLDHPMLRPGGRESELEVEQWS
ncbi:MAG: hypothetical protein QF464_22140, partial [Myxococcota bacterium]|nr:hypothetical protein [Myxococcota bacterium]